mmetsp:Transcript_37816/g.77138  ORF Transcript_37816/g.77138 Transcript_37816/m.77138 type:complete len:176 (+) Transcript_37816:1537-2064(+)
MNMGHPISDILQNMKATVVQDKPIETGIIVAVLSVEVLLPGRMGVEVIDETAATIVIAGTIIEVAGTITIEATATVGLAATAEGVITTEKETGGTETETVAGEVAEIEKAGTEEDVGVVVGHGIPGHPVPHAIVEVGVGAEAGAGAMKKGLLQEEGAIVNGKAMEVLLIPLTYNV